MLPRSLHRQIFKTQQSTENQLSPETLTKIKDHLTEHNLWGRPTSTLPNIEFQLPSLVGKNLPEHFEKIAKKQCKTYTENLLQLITHPVPDLPLVWNFAPGWTRYSENGDMTSIDYPDENAYVFDVEVCVLEGHAPTLATAVSNSYWYSWCSHQLFEQKVRKYALVFFIPLVKNLRINIYFIVLFSFRWEDLL
jgi:DNA polymerase gamma 1